MMGRVEADFGLAKRSAILTSIPGVSRLTAFALLIERPGLGTLEAAQAASLTGLAPVARQRILNDHNTTSMRTVRRGAGQSGEQVSHPEFIDGRDGCFGASSG